MIYKSGKPTSFARSVALTCCALLLAPTFSLAQQGRNNTTFPPVAPAQVGRGGIQMKAFLMDGKKRAPVSVQIPEGTEQVLVLPVAPEGPDEDSGAPQRSRMTWQSSVGQPPVDVTRAYPRLYNGPPHVPGYQAYYERIRSQVGSAKTSNPDQQAAAWKSMIEANPMPKELEAQLLKTSAETLARSGVVGFDESVGGIINKPRNGTLGIKEFERDFLSKPIIIVVVIVMRGTPRSALMNASGLYEQAIQSVAKSESFLSASISNTWQWPSWACTLCKNVLNAFMPYVAQGASWLVGVFCQLLGISAQEATWIILATYYAVSSWLKRKDAAGWACRKLGKCH